MNDDQRISRGERVPSVLVQVGGHPCAITPFGAYGNIPLKPGLMLRLREQYGPGAVFTAMDTDYALLAALFSISASDLPDAYTEEVRRDLIINAIRGACHLDKLLKQCGGFDAASKYILDHMTKKA